MEDWRSLNGLIECGENYVVSTYGSVMNVLTGRKLKPLYKRGGYYDVVLCNNKKRKYVKIHRLVALAFIENPKNKSSVNHIDGVKTNNHVTNLEWATPQENYIHALKTGLASVEKQTEILNKFNSQQVIQ